MMKWNQFVQGDAFEIMPEMEDGSVDFLFTSPPDISQTEFEKDIESFKSSIIICFVDLCNLLSVCCYLWLFCLQIAKSTANDQRIWIDCTQTARG